MVYKNPIPYKMNPLTGEMEYDPNVDQGPAQPLMPAWQANQQQLAPLPGMPPLGTDPGMSAPQTQQQPTEAPNNNAPWMQRHPGVGGFLGAALPTALMGLVSRAGLGPSLGLGLASGIGGAMNARQMAALQKQQADADALQSKRKNYQAATNFQVLAQQNPELARRLSANGEGFTTLTPEQINSTTQNVAQYGDPSLYSEPGGPISKDNVRYTKGRAQEVAKATEEYSQLLQTKRQLEAAGGSNTDEYKGIIARMAEIAPNVDTKVMPDSKDAISAIKLPGEITEQTQNNQWRPWLNQSTINTQTAGQASSYASARNSNASAANQETENRMQRILANPNATPEEKQQANDYFLNSKAPGTADTIKTRQEFENNLKNPNAPLSTLINSASKQNSFTPQYDSDGQLKSTGNLALDNRLRQAGGQELTLQQILSLPTDIVDKLPQMSKTQRQTIKDHFFGVKKKETTTGSSDTADIIDDGD